MNNTITPKECNDLLTSIAVNVFLLETELDHESPAFQYLSRIKKELAEAHFLATAGSTVVKGVGMPAY